MSDTVRLDFAASELGTPMVVLGRGFLGARLESCLHSAGHTVLTLDRSTCDLLDTAWVREVLHAVPPGASFFLPAAVTRLRSNDRRAFDQNLRIVQNVLDALPSDARHIVFISTIDVYGVNPGNPIQETTRVDPDDHYAMAKAAGEFLVRKEAEARGISWTVFRLSGIYGPGDEGKSTIHRMTTAALGVRKVSLTGDPQVERDFVWVEDVAALAERAARERVAGIFNVATGRSRTIAEIALAVATTVGPEVRVVQESFEMGERASQLRFDISRLCCAFPGFGMTPLEEGLTAYVNRLRSAET
jgi:nucleoside-diphosphate-sugar epimerase